MKKKIILIAVSCYMLGVAAIAQDAKNNVKPALARKTTKPVQASVTKSTATNRVKPLSSVANNQQVTVDKQTYRNTQKK